MKKLKLTLSVVILMLLISACSGVSETVTEVPPTPTVLIEPVETELLIQEPTCQPAPLPPEPSLEDVIQYSPNPEVDWVKGPDNARITIVEYADFQCPYCSVASTNLRALIEKYPEDIRIVYRHFPLASIHDKAILATQAAEAAGLQGEEGFWAMHDLLYETQAEWSALTVDEFTSWLIEQSEVLGLDTVLFETDLNSEPIVTMAEATWIKGQELGIPGTPHIKINSVYDAQADPQMLTAIVEMIKLEDRQFSDCPPMTVDSEATYHATIETEAGPIVLKLFPDIAPLAVNSFIFLAENDWFDGVTFHRVMPGFVAQTGDPTGTGFGGPGYYFSNEVSDILTFDRKGLVAMANAGPDTNGSQFFITYDATPDLNGFYTIFGEVIEGMDLVENFTPRNPQQGVEPPPGDALLNITIEKQ